MKAEERGAAKFVDYWAKHHGMPRAITSDRGTNWTSTFWKEFCRLMGVQQRLSFCLPPTNRRRPREAEPRYTSIPSELYQPRAVRLEEEWLSTAQLALNGRYHAGIGTSLFFAVHGYEAPSPVALQPEPKGRSQLAASERATQFVEKMKSVTELCQASMADTAQKQEGERQSSPDSGTNLSERRQGLAGLT